MLNLSQETKAVLLFGSVYRLRPLSLGSRFKWVDTLNPPRQTAFDERLKHVCTMWADCNGLDNSAFHQPLMGGSSEAQIPRWLLDHSLGQQHPPRQPGCVPLSWGGQGGYNQIFCTTS